MTASDKFGIALAVGITIVFVAIAGSFASMESTPAPMPVPVPTPAPAPMPVPVPTPAPAPVEEAIVEEEPTPVEEAPMEEEPSAPSAVDVSIPKGSSLPGCEENDECFMPSMVTVSVDGTVTWTNDDTAAHTVTSGTASDGPDGVFDSSILMAGKTFEHTFDEEGSYDYFCVVHPWMTGNVTVE
ncbi:cupredoxin domain-containing protein [Candidatus Nitrosotenuis chungbukensis]|uniref:cupredoxin domain-containing protein n=1 Tax=Candidatus Nitrosotenuis chungbukensis TaxID=1353246 RepID=UPI0006936326|nr:plastocyanin/azurin family copper-binding protein [Candidatus Nitrosotenuis chungbukensis]